MQLFSQVSAFCMYYQKRISNERNQQKTTVYSIDIWPAGNSILEKRETNLYIVRCASVLAWSYLSGSQPEQLVIIDLFTQHQRFAVCCTQLDSLWKLLSWTVNQRNQIKVFLQIRGNQILEKLSKTRFFTRFENLALFPYYVAAEKRAGISNLVKYYALESVMVILSFTLLSYFIP